VLITPMERRRWNGTEPGSTLDDYAKAVRDVAAQEKVGCIDLHAMSLQLYKALGPEGSKKAFVHYPAGTFPGKPEALKDDTHHNGFGGYELARCVVEGIRALGDAELAGWVAETAGKFDPKMPDPPDSIAMPTDPAGKISEKPAGS
jgi:hypothetical protein